MKTNIISANELGRAATFMVLADLILNGYKAISSDEAFPYDIVAEVKGKLIKIQVKSLSKKSCYGKASRTPFYNFIMKQGKVNKPYLDGQVDGFALVMLDIKTIAYMPKKGFEGWSVALADKNEKREGRKNSNASRRRFWQDMTLDSFIKTIK
jgi:hypothetical protein